jgi:hypothetical protein
MTLSSTMPLRRLHCTALLGFLSLFPLSLSAAEYQWSATVDEVVSTETNDHPRAFLWIPSACRRVRAVVIGQHNMQEEPILEHPAFRKEMSALCFAEVWVTPAMGSNHFRFDQGAGPMLAHLMRTLADRSGYAELARAPLVPIGHSAMASFGWDMAAWDPARVLAVISSSGMWPYFKEGGSGNSASPDWGDRTIDGVPGLIVKGEYEVQGNMRSGWYAGVKGDSLKTHPMTALTHVVEPGGGHFDASDERVALMALFLRKAAKYRLTGKAAADGATKLASIDPRHTGWLFDGWQLDTAPAAPAAPVAAYRGPRDDAYWAFDGEMAVAIERLQSRFRNQRTVLLGYRQRDGLVRPRPDHAMVHLKFEPLDDDLHFKLGGGFWDVVPGDGKAEPATGQEGVGGWGGMLAEGRGTVRAGDALPHPDAAATAAMRIARICGPVVQTGADTFAVRFYRMGITNAKRSNDIWFALTWPGDGEYKQMVQQAHLQFPLTNKVGQPQTLDFPGIPDQRAGAGLTPIRLGAKSSAGVPVHYYVREGPAEVSEDGMLTFTALPRRARFPIEVTVVAWQWGRAVEPKLQSAQPVERRFLIIGP